MSVDKKAFKVAYSHAFGWVCKVECVSNVLYLDLYSFIKKYNEIAKPAASHQPDEPPEFILHNLPEPLKQLWEKLRPYVNGPPELLSLLYDLDLMPEQIIRKRDFVRMMQIAEWFKLRQPERESSKEITRARQLVTLIRCSLGRKFQTSDYLPDRFDDANTPPARNLITEACAEFMEHQKNMHYWAEKAENTLSQIEGERK